MYSEQDVNNALLLKYEATDCRDCFRDENQVEFSKGEKIYHGQLYVLA